MLVFYNKKFEKKDLTKISVEYVDYKNNIDRIIFYHMNKENNIK